MSCTVAISSPAATAFQSGPADRRAAARATGGARKATLWQQRRHGRRCAGTIRRSGGEVEGNASADPELVAGVVHGKYLLDAVSMKPPTELGKAALFLGKKAKSAKFFVKPFVRFWRQ